MSLPIRLPIKAPSYSAGGANFYIDKTGAIYQTWVGRTVAGGDWGSHVYRTAPGAPSTLLFFQPGSNGFLEVMNGQLWFGFCDAKGGQWRLLIDGYIDPSDTPSSTVVNVDEAQVAGLKQGLGTAQATADRAIGAANQATAIARQAESDVDTLTAQVNALQAQVTAMQSQALTKAQIEDIVWAKIWDVNYLIRLGFIKGSSDIQQVQDYLVDLASYIKRIVKL
jgi:hypothetical protein